jgi:uncharacterized membrane protein YfcA
MFMKPFLDHRSRPYGVIARPWTNHACYWVDNRGNHRRNWGFCDSAVPYLQAIGLSKDNLIQALGLSFTVLNNCTCGGLGAWRSFPCGNITLSALAVIPSLLGTWVGTTVRERISAATFRRWFLIFLAILGLELVVRPFFL